MKMRENYFWITLPALMLAAGSLLAGPPQAVTECGTFITEPGKYRLVNDLVDCPVSGVEILSSDVTLDLMGYTVSCAYNGLRNGGVMAWGEPGAPVRNVKITNGQVTGCSDGVLIAWAEDSKITKITSWGNRLWEGQSGTGITVWLSQHNVIMHNHAYGNEDAGIGSWESNGNLFKHNTSIDNYLGIYTDTETDSRILCNHTYGNAGGIVLGPYSSGNLLRGNVASGNVYTGIEMLGIAWDGFLWRDIPAGNTVRSNIAEENGVDDFTEAFYDLVTGESLVHPDGTCRNTWEKNQFETELGPPGCFGVPYELEVDDVCALDDDD
jgi:parallel beta-helix repeat protein